MSVAGTDMVLEAGRQSRKPKLMLVVWLAALASVYAVWMWGKDYLPWAFKVPRDLRLPARTWIGNAMNWLVDSATFGLFTFTELTRFLAGVVEAPYRAVLSLLSTGVLQGQGSDAVQLLPPLSWIAVMSVVGLLGYYAGGRKLALLVTVCFGFIALFGQWNNAMITLASILIAVPLGAAGGLLLGIAAWRWPVADKMLRPVLDLMQTIPVFAYLVPILVLFGFGPTAAIIATIIYAMPPMTRITTLALRAVAPEISDLGNMVGCTRRQMVWKVMVPSAMQSLMVGINQVIMLSLNMVIIASMIGAGGLGYEVLTALRRLDIGTGVEAGICHRRAGRCARPAVAGPGPAHARRRCMRSRPKPVCCPGIPTRLCIDRCDDHPDWPVRSGAARACKPSRRPGGSPQATSGTRW
jgi:glycine betaine/proline transport system permease protein